MPILQGPRLLLRAVVTDDRAPLLAILREPAVARWWSSPTTDAEDWALLSAYGDDENEAIRTWAITLAHVPVGWICAWEKLDPTYRHAGVDVVLTTSAHGRGYGPEAIRLVCRFLFEQRDHHRITIDPAAANTNAVAAYTKVGFRPVGVLRHYERSHDGTFHDGLLLELLRGELRDVSST